MKKKPFLEVPCFPVHISSGTRSTFKSAVYISASGKPDYEELLRFFQSVQDTYRIKPWVDFKE